MKRFRWLMIAFLVLAIPLTACSSGSESSRMVTPTDQSSIPGTKVKANPPKPVIFIDPGHSPRIVGQDKATGLNVTNYENEPEMRDVYAVALIVKARLEKAGYRVVMSRPTLQSSVLLNEIAAHARKVHAALAISIHDQAGATGGISFASGNNNVYYQSVGTYRKSRANGKITKFHDPKLASVSKRFGEIIQAARAKAQGHSVRLMANTGYDLGTRPTLDHGNIWMVQLLSGVPWIYNEAGGNSAGMVGLNSADKQRYAAGLVAGIEACVPLDK